MSKLTTLYNWWKYIANIFIIGYSLIILFIMQNEITYDNDVIQLRCILNNGNGKLIQKFIKYIKLFFLAIIISIIFIIIIGLPVSSDKPSVITSIYMVLYIIVITILMIGMIIFSMELFSGYAEFKSIKSRLFDNPLYHDMTKKIQNCINNNMINIDKMIDNVSNIKNEMSTKFNPMKSINHKYLRIHQK